MNILIITDSLGLPRPFPEQVNYNETWCYQLSEKFNTHQLSIGGATILELYSQITYWKLFKPDLVIVQAGIVDCAPRALTKIENQLINKYTFSRRLFNKYSKTLIPMMRRRGITYTSKGKFEQGVKQFYNDFKDSLYWIGIAPPSIEYEIKLPGISRNIQIYNQIIRDNIGHNYIDVSDLNESKLMSDFIHLNSEGHKFISEKILNSLYKYNNILNHKNIIDFDSGI